METKSVTKEAPVMEGLALLRKSIDEASALVILLGDRINFIRLPSPHVCANGSGEEKERPMSGLRKIIAENERAVLNVCQLLREIIDDLEI